MAIAPTPDHKLHTTSVDFAQNLQATYARLRAGLKQKPRDYEWRKEQLLNLRRLLIENNDALNEAVWKDLRKSAFECQASEQGSVISEINETLKHLKTWMTPQKVKTPIFNWPATSHIVREPLGLTLVIGAWNYPINILLTPVVGAIAGGNACLIKPSEISANTAKLISHLIPKYMDSDLIAVIEADVQQTSQILDQQFDLIFFTGSTAVGKIVYQKAAQHLTPVVLELGGKSPVVILKDTDLDVAARRVAWGKFINAGQTCIAPDYALVQNEVKADFIERVKQYAKKFYGENASESPDYCRIVNEKHFDRLQTLVANPSNPTSANRSDRFIPPTVIEVSPSHALMEEEIFGPILPVVGMNTESEMIDFINSKPKPLALYVFTDRDQSKSAFTEQTSSGGLLFNDVIMHMPSPELPFGGVGASGIGSYHGKFSFDAFTHAKGVVRKSTAFDVPVRYAPYTLNKIALLKKLFS